MKTQFEKFVFIVLFWSMFTLILIQRVESQENKNLVVTTIAKNGKKIDVISVPGRPPKDYRAPLVNIPKSIIAPAINSLTYVPAFDWSYGCSATSGAMVAGYYDNSGYKNIYAGPSFSGVMPKNNSIWGYTHCAECPLSASHNGIDGRTTRGHVDDYWIVFGHTGPDPYISNGWTEHAHSECTADFMKTNQSAFRNSDGNTKFWFWNDGSALDFNEMVSIAVADTDGCYGLKLFFESRGYTVIQGYNQYIDALGKTHGFTFAQYKQEIDAGRPVLIHVDNHTMVGFGYDDTGNTVYLHDTWDYANHSMAWGGSYSSLGLNHYGVSVIELQSVTDVTAPSLPGTPTDAGVWSSSPKVIFTWTPATDGESDVIDYQLQVGTTPGGNDIFDDWLVLDCHIVGVSSDYRVTGSHWQTLYARVRAKNGLRSIGPWSGNSDGIIINTPPSATNPAITPSDPLTDNDLAANYAYYDADGDPESKSEIRWYKNNVQQPSYDDLRTVPSSATAKCQNWHFTVKPFDGMLYGSIATSPQVHIRNTPPTASNLYISPANPLDTQDLTANYTYYDADGDLETGSEIQWYKNNVHQPAYDNMNPLPASATIATEYWHFTVKPYDGEDFGTLQTLSPAVPIDMRVVLEAEAMQGRLCWCGNCCPDGWRLNTQDHSIYETVDFPADFLYHFTVTAKGELAGEAAPWLGVQIGTEFAGTCEITSTDWGDYSFIAPLTAGLQRIDLTYLNDWCDPEVGDRNLLLDKVVIRCQFNPLPGASFTYEAEAMSQQNHTLLDPTGNYAVLYRYYSYVAHGMFFEQSELDFEIIARAEFGSGGWPEMELWIDSNVQSVTVNNASPASYFFHATGISPGGHCVKIDFKNNSWATDRKIWVDKLIIHTTPGGLLKPETNEPINAKENTVTVPDRFALSQNFPNPFNPETNISFQIPEESDVVLKIFDLMGKEIRTLVSETKPAGHYTVQWDGRDYDGNKVVSGLYLYQLQAGNFSCIKKMALMK